MKYTIGIFFLFIGFLISSAQEKSSLDFKVGFDLYNYKLEEASIYIDAPIIETFSSAPTFCLAYNVPKHNSSLEFSTNYNILVTPTIVSGLGTIYYQRYAWYLSYYYHFNKISLGLGYSQIAFKHEAYLPWPNTNYGRSPGINFSLRSKLLGQEIELRNNLVYNFYTKDGYVYQNWSLRVLWNLSNPKPKEDYSSSHTYLPEDDKLILGALANVNVNPYEKTIAFQNPININLGFSLEYFHPRINAGLFFSRQFWLDLTLINARVISSGYTQMNYLGINYYLQSERSEKYWRFTLSHAWIAERNIAWQESEFNSLYPNKAINVGVGYSIFPRVESTFSADYYYQWSPKNTGGIDWSRLRFGLRFILF